MGENVHMFFSIAAGFFYLFCNGQSLVSDRSSVVPVQVQPTSVPFLLQTLFFLVSKWHTYICYHIFFIHCFEFIKFLVLLYGLTNRI